MNDEVFLTIVGKIFLLSVLSMLATAFLLSSIQVRAVGLFFNISAVLMLGVMIDPFEARKEVWY